MGQNMAFSSPDGSRIIARFLFILFYTYGDAMEPAGAGMNCIFKVAERAYNMKAGHMAAPAPSIS
jgi:hypothetical protein